MIVVRKYGGTSVASPQHIKRVAAQIASARAKGEEAVVVVSAMAGETNRLIGLAESIMSGAHGREYAVLLSTGEVVSSSLLVLALAELGVPAEHFDGKRAGILTDSVYQRAKILDVNPKELLQAVKNGIVPVVAGFQGVNEHGEVTVLARGGSDDTAVWLTAALDAERCDIFTDVEGVFTTDPNVCPKARIHNELSFEEMMELASLGAKVLQLHSVENAANKNVELYVKPSHLALANGTRISRSAKPRMPLAGIAFRRGDVLIKISPLPAGALAVKKIIDPLMAQHIELDMLTREYLYEGAEALFFTIDQGDLPFVRTLLSLAQSDFKEAGLSIVTDLARVSVVGEEMAKNPNLARDIFTKIRAMAILPRGISITQMSLTMLIENKDLHIAVNELHKLTGLDAIS